MMKIDSDIDSLQADKAKIEHLLSIHRHQINPKFESGLELEFWEDRQSRLIKTVRRAIVPTLIIFFIFNIISLTLNYFAADTVYRAHDISRNAISFAATWVLLFTIYFMVNKRSWNLYYSPVVAVVLCFTLTMTQSILLSMQTSQLAWRGSIVIVIGVIFAYLYSGLRPRITFLAGMISVALTFTYFEIASIHVPLWAVINVLILPSLAGLGLLTLSISSDRIRFLQSVIIGYDKKIYTKLNQHFILLSHQDTLTLLGNRRGFEQQLISCIENTKTTHSPFALLFIDVDYFKLYNDTYGHDQGDNALIRVAQTLLRHIHEGDAAIRYGGEEFVVLLKETVHTEAIKIAENILNDIRMQKIEHKSSRIGDYLTVSIGLTIYQGEVDTNYPALLKIADQALYSAKNTGRDRYVTL